MERSSAKRTKLAVSCIAVLIMALGLSGCIQVEVESEFKSDGSARHSLSTTVDRSMVDEEMLDGELDFDEMKQGARGAGMDVEQIDESDQVGIRVILDVDDNEDPGSALNRLFNATGGDADPIDGFAGSFTESGGGLSSTTYQFELTVDGDALFDDGEEELDEELDDEFGMEFDANMMRQFINLTYTVSLPGEVTEHNGNAIGESQVQWELPFEGTQTFTAESREDSGLSLGLILGAGGGFLAILLLVLGGVVLMRSRSAPAQAAPVATGSPAAGLQPAMQPQAAVANDDPAEDPDPVIDAENDPNAPDLDRR